MFGANGSPLANQSDIQALWWDVTQPKDASRPVGKTLVGTTDSSGFIKLDLSNVTGLSPGDYGFLLLYQLNGANHQNSPTFSGKVQTSTIASGVDMYYYDSGWTRPSDWLTLPTLTDADNKFVGLHAVFPGGSNFCALSADGAYTVDWGDGVVENFASGVTAQHQYDYSSAALTGTDCSRGYKQAIVTVTPQAGQTFSLLNLNLRHTSTTVLHASGFLDIAIAGSQLSSLTVSAAVQNVRMSLLEQVKLYANGVTNMSYMFYGCYSLQSVPLFNTAAVTNMSYMFQNCFSLQSVPLFNTAAVTNMSYMFQNCFSLQSVPAFNTAAVTNMGNMFYGCSSLQSVPLFNTAAVTSMSYMFPNCFSLQSVPLFNTAAVTNMSYMFYQCYALQSVPLFNTAAVTNMSSMFQNCASLQSVPLFNTAAVTNMSYMFPNCFSLQSVPAFNTAAVTIITSMFSSCNSLRKIDMTGTKVTFSVASCNLDAAALNALYTSLATVTGQTLTVTGNLGTATDNPAIATAKGWTVTG